MFYVGEELRKTDSTAGLSGGAPVVAGNDYIE
jgi:hypothetical protein